MKIGEGAYSKVYVAVSIADGKKVAVKVSESLFISFVMILIFSSFKIFYRLGRPKTAE